MAVSIPIFTAQLRKSELATDLANIRAAYAEEVATAIADGQDSVSIAKADLDAVLKHSTATYTNGTAGSSKGKIALVHKSDSSITGEFEVDDNVTFS